jgi:nucleoside triphosphate diphosphatase
MDEFMQPSNDISRLLEIMAALRDPQTGCPWDVVQTFATIVPYTLEEAHEVADAVERNDMPDLCDELGDLLLQVVFHARMAEELGHFGFGDVVRAITEKMIRRHPHVFGSEDARSAGMAKGMWNKIKAEEKALRAQRRAGSGLARQLDGTILDAVPGSLPAIAQSVKLQDQAAKVGFDWTEPEPILSKIEEEIGELRDAMDEGADDRIGEEYGDILFAMMNLGRRLGIDPDSALRKTNAKFRQRFGYVETHLRKQGIALEKAGLSRMEALWQEAKTSAK